VTAVVSNDAIHKLGIDEKDVHPYLSQQPAAQVLAESEHDQPEKITIGK
jgi:hypothetical protein